MFDTMTWVKIVGGFCGSLLVFLFANWAAHSIYFGGEGGEESPAAYSVAVADAGTTETKSDAAADPAYADVSASADATAGQAIFKKNCTACHKIDGANATGPHLNGVVNRPHASVEGFAYSEAMLSHEGEPWTPDALYAFLKSPKTAMPGTKMGFAGLPKPQDRANLIAYLSTLQ